MRESREWYSNSNAVSNVCVEICNTFADIDLLQQQFRDGIEFAARDRLMWNGLKVCSAFCVLCSVFCVLCSVIDARTGLLTW